MSDEPGQMRCDECVVIEAEHSQGYMVHRVLGMAETRLHMAVMVRVSREALQVEIDQKRAVRRSGRSAGRGAGPWERSGRR